MAFTAFVVVVPEAQALVGDLRLAGDETAALGMPPHVSVLVPFLPPGAITEAVLREAAEAFAGVAAFDCTLDEVRRWPEVVCLAPRPAGPFVELTQRIVARFPAFPPYGGRHAAIVPHLTVASGSRAAAETAEPVMRQRFAVHGPVRTRCDRVELVGNASGRWETLATLSLGAA